MIRQKGISLTNFAFYGRLTCLS